MFDVAIIDGEVYSGDGLPKLLNIGINSDKISYVGKDNISAHKTISAKGHIVTPGFIDIHTHSDLSFNIDPDADSKLIQGVTFELMGNCGMSFCAPLSSNTKPQLQDRMNRQGIDLEIRWNDFNGWLNEISSNTPAINVAAQVGHGSIRAHVMGMEARNASPEEIIKMQDEIRKSIDQGVLGFSTGLWYAPGSYSHTEEIVQLAKISSEKDLLYSSHIRSESDDACGLFPAHAEAIEIARRTKGRVQISHVKSVGPKFWGRGIELIEGIERARKEGLDVAGDQYPYYWSSTPISGCMFPRWSLEGGREKTLERLKDSDIRENIKKETTNFINRFHGAEGCVLADYPIQSSLEGLNLVEISKEFNTTPEEAVMKLYEKSEGSFVLHSVEEEDVNEIAKYSNICVASDGNSLRDTGPLSSGKPHPRSYATNSRYLESFVKEKRIVSLVDAIYRMTALPAQRIGLKRRGKLLKDYFADINIFKLEDIKDNATYKDPHKYSEGMKYVFVNGKLSVEGGQKISGRYGRVIRSLTE